MLLGEMGLPLFTIYIYKDLYPILVSNQTLIWD